MGDPEAHALHCGYDRAGGSRSPGGDLDSMVPLLLWLFGGVNQHAENHRSTAHVSYAALLDQGEDDCGVDSAEANVGPGDSGDSPGVSPAVAMEHGESPQVYAVPVESKHHPVAHSIQECSAMVEDDSLGVAGCAGGVVEGDGFPFVGDGAGGEVIVTLFKERLVVLFADEVTRRGKRVVDVNYGDGTCDLGERFFDYGGEFHGRL